MNIKKTSVITLIALLSCDTFAASSIVRAGVTPLGQATGVRATPSAGNSTNRASLGIGSYYDINKLRPNRTQTSAGGSTGGSTGGSSNNVSNSALESVRQELTEVKTTLTKQISDLVKLVEAKNAEIQNLQNDLADATEEIEQIAGKKYVIESDLVDRFNQIKEAAVRGAIDAVNDSSYAKGSYVDQEIEALRSEITAERNKALEPYAKKEVVRTEIADAKQAAIDTATANVTAQGYISAATVQENINTAKNAAIADALEQAKLAVQSTLETYATKDDVDTAKSAAITAIENKNYATKDDVNTAKSAAITAIENKNYATKTDVDTAESDAIKAIEEKGYLTQTELDTLEQKIKEAREADLKNYATMGYVDNATNDLTDNGYVTNADLTTLESKITKARDEVLDSYVTIAKAQEDAKTVKQDAADLAIQQATEGKLFATPDEVNTAKLAAIADAVADVKNLNYATNDDVTDLSNNVTTSIAGLQTQITAADEKLSTLDTQLGNATENALTTEAVNGLIAKALSDGKYITQSILNDRAGEITSSISALDNKFAIKTYVDNTFAQKSVIGQIQNDISGLDGRITTNSTDLTNNQNTLKSLENQLTTARADITNLQTGAEGAINMENVETAIDTALANKKYATSADLAKSVLEIQDLVKNDYATYTYVDDKITSANDDIIKIKLPDYATVATVNSLQGQLNTTDSNLAALTERTATLEGDAGDYVTNGKLADELAPYATNEALAKYVTRDEIKTAFDDTKPLVTTNSDGKLTFVKDNFNAAVLPNLDGYVTNTALGTKLGDYATNDTLADYVTRDEIKTAFMVPDGTGAEPKPLIQYEGEGKWTFVKDNFESAVNGVTNVANMQGLYNWFIGKDTTNDGGWFAKDKNNVFTLKDGFAKSIKDLKEVGTDNSLFVQTSTLDNYATKDYVTTEVGNLPSSEKEMPEEWQKSIFGVLRPLVSEEPNGEWKFQESKFNAAVQTNLTGYVTTGELEPYAKTADIENKYATQTKLTALEKELDTDYIKTDDLAKKIVDSYAAGKLTELKYATKSELATEIAKITPEIEDVNSLISRVDALEAYKTGDISIVAGEVAGKLIGNSEFMGEILDAASGADTSTFVTKTFLTGELEKYALKTVTQDIISDFGTLQGQVEKNASDVAKNASKLAPIAVWFGQTEEGSYKIDNGAIAKSIANLTRYDLDDTATGDDAKDPLFATTESVKQDFADIGDTVAQELTTSDDFKAEVLKLVGDDITALPGRVGAVETAIAGFDDKYATKTQFNDLEKQVNTNASNVAKNATDVAKNASKLAPIAVWFGQTEEGSYKIDNGATAKSIAGLTRYDYEGEAAGEAGDDALFAMTKSVDDLVQKVAKNTTDVAKNASDVAKNASKLAPIAGWFGQTEEGPYQIDNGAIAKSIAGLTRSNFDDTATGEAGKEPLFAQTTAVKSLEETVSGQETRVQALEDSSVKKAELKTILTTETNGKVPLIEMLITQADKSANTDALLLRALTTDDKTGEKQLLSNALVFKKEGDKVPLVLKLQTDEGKQMLASQDNYTTLSSKYTTLESNYNTLDGEYDTLGTTVRSLYDGADRLFAQKSDGTLSLNTEVFTNEMASAISIAKGGEQCSTDFRGNALTDALTQETCERSSTGK